MSFALAVIFTAAAVAAACALSGVFLVIRRMAMMADAITHAVLPGLVAAYVLARGPNIIAGVLGAAAAGLLTVVLVEALTKSKRLKDDAAIGLVFPALFALGVFIVSRWFANVHIDMDSVLYGELVLAPLDTVRSGEFDFGPKAAWTGVVLLVVNAAFLVLAWKPLTMASFDPESAEAQGVRVRWVNMALMTLVSVTAVGAFSAVGAVMAVSLIVVPTATALLFSRRMPAVIGLALAIGTLGSILGAWLAGPPDVSISGMIAVVQGAVFGLSALFAPHRGLIAILATRARQRSQFAAEALVIHLATHEGSTTEADEADRDHLVTELGWSELQADAAVREASRLGHVQLQNRQLQLTEKGRQRARSLAQELGLPST